MVTVRCSRCGRPLPSAGGCPRCGRTVTAVLPGSLPWPQARRWLDDAAPRRDRRPLVAAAVLVLAAVLLVLLAFR